MSSSGRGVAPGVASGGIGVLNVTNPGGAAAESIFGSGAGELFLRDTTGAVDQRTIRIGVFGTTTFFQAISDNQGTTKTALEISCDSTTAAKVSFFGAAPVAQAATPVTLADVIAILRNLGLAA